MEETADRVQILKALSSPPTAQELAADQPRELSECVRRWLDAERIRPGRSRGPNHAALTAQLKRWCAAMGWTCWGGFSVRRFTGVLRGLGFSAWCVRNQRGFYLDRASATRLTAQLVRPPAQE